MRREAGKKEQEPVLLTLSNAVDQTQKIKVEVSPSTTIKQASIDAGVAPKGAFDVFTAGGKAVTKSKASNHRNEVTYRAFKHGFSIEEPPIVFVEREEGTSKMSRGIVLEAILNVPRLRFSRS